MDTQYHALPTAPLSPSTDLLRVNERPRHFLTMDSPALEVMTDLNMVQPVTIPEDASLDKANELMVQRGIRMLFVVDNNDRLSGLVTTTDILGERPMQCIREQGRRHADILVRDVMTPRQSLEALSLSDVRVSKVGHMLTTMRRLGRQHALVVDQDKLCGLFSTSQMARRLGVALNFIPMPQSVSEIQQTLLHGA
jgi:CBS domain containing-hemolysin-like protein